MSKIFFIRHGQASFLKSEYDQLSSLGERQARILGKYWKKIMPQVDQVYSGNLKRQVDTAKAFLNGMDCELSVNRHPGFNEHHGPSIVKYIYPDKFPLDRVIPEGQYDNLRREFYAAYFSLAIPWIRDELSELLPTSHENWKDFRKRFRDGLAHVFDQSFSGSTILIFTSGGPVGVALGEALDLSDENAVQLGWQVKNASFSELLYSKDRFSVVSFNETPHLDHPELITMV